jgi:TMEM175 potassium channel family protein
VLYQLSYAGARLILGGIAAGLVAARRRYPSISVAPAGDDPAVAKERVPKRREGNEIEFSRIVAFSDGVFAIAITLLVLNFDISRELAGSEVAEALWDERENLLAFAVSFAVIGRFWVVHHRFFGEVKAFDGRLIGLNLVYLGWIVLIPFSSEVLGEYASETAAVVLYSANLAGVVLIGMLMMADAHRAGLISTDVTEHRESRIRSLYIAFVFLLSIPVAFVAPGVAPLLWLALFLDPSARLARR